MEWQVVTVFIALVGLMGTVGAPVIKLNSTIVKLNSTIQAMEKRLGTVEKQAQENEAHSRKSHEKIHGRIDVVEDRIHDHETRITMLEGGKK